MTMVNDMVCYDCGHDESAHESVEYRGVKARACFNGRYPIIQSNGSTRMMGKRCPCRGFRVEPTWQERAEAAEAMLAQFGTAKE